MDEPSRVHDEAGSPRRGHSVAALLIVVGIGAVTGLLFPAHVHGRMATTTPPRISASAVVVEPLIVAGSRAHSTPPATGHIVWLYYHNKWRPVPR